jgi:hypothetical protein
MQNNLKINYPKKLNKKKISQMSNIKLNINLKIILKIYQLKK